jgi:hypothetical protein
MFVCYCLYCNASDKKGTRTLSRGRGGGGLRVDSAGMCGHVLGGGRLCSEPPTLTYRKVTSAVTRMTLFNGYILGTTRRNFCLEHFRLWPAKRIRLDTHRPGLSDDVIHLTIRYEQWLPNCGPLGLFQESTKFFADMDMSYARVLHIKVAYLVPHK